MSFNTAGNVSPFMFYAFVKHQNNVSVDVVLRWTGIFARSASSLIDCYFINLVLWTVLNKSTHFLPSLILLFFNINKCRGARLFVSRADTGNWKIGLQYINDVYCSDICSLYNYVWTSGKLSFYTERGIIASWELIFFHLVGSMVIAACISLSWNLPRIGNLSEIDSSLPNLKLVLNPKSVPQTSRGYASVA